MEILNNIWVALTTENANLANLLVIPLGILEAFAYLLLFTSVLKITYNKKQALIFIICESIIGSLCSILIPKPYSNILSIIITPLIIIFVFKVNFLKSIFCEFLILSCVALLEIFFTRLFLIVFHINYEACATIPIFRFSILLLIYLIIFLISKIINHSNLHINIFNGISKRNKFIIASNILFAILVIFMQIYLIVYYNDKLPTFIILINVLSLLAYFFISIYSMVKTMKLQKTTEDLEQEKLYNKTLQILHDSVRAFKHDFSNIIAGIGGYVETNDIEGLKGYYHQLLQDCGQVNNLSSLNPDSINSPAVYTVLANKYYKADELGIKINMESFIDFNNLLMQIYEFTRILGILMDNAIEAASECDEKVINVTIRNDIRQHRQLLIVENTYKNKDINLDKIYEKGFSTKQKNTGLGLWEVNKIINKHKNITRFTTKTDKFFRQQIEIYEK